MYNSEDDNMAGDLRRLPSRSDIVLVVEPDEVIRSALHFILNARMTTYSCASLDRAHAHAADAAADLVLLGADLLKDAGAAALIGLRQLLPAAKIMIVANTVHDPLAVKALKWGAHDILGKPISFELVHRRVDSLLRRRGKAAWSAAQLFPATR